ncbi:hypothetical protein ACFE04_019192 [Oxalis oulophora]
MEPWLVDDLTDDLQSISFTSTTTTSLNRSTSSGSSFEAATLTPAPSAHGSFSSTTSSKPTIILRSKSNVISLSDIKFSLRLGSGDIGSVYLAELKSGGIEGSLFAVKVMDKKELISRSKEGRARTEKEILELLDHPFLPSLFATIDSPKWLCLLTEFCPGGDLHVLRQRQPNKRFHETAVRFYASENPPPPPPAFTLDPPPFTSSSCILPNCIVPAVSCFHPKRKRKKKTGTRTGPEFVSEPIDVRSMSFVGTHEYLAPEIVSGEGHGSPVDWWTLGIFMFELFYGVTPFRGVDNELTLANIVARALEFPKEPSIPATAKDLISQLLVKDPARRMGSTTGASAIKHHPFFQGVNWALLRCTAPPFVPPPFSRQQVVSDESCPDAPVEYY